VRDSWPGFGSAGYRYSGKPRTGKGGSFRRDLIASSRLVHDGATGQRGAWSVNGAEGRCPLRAVEEHRLEQRSPTGRPPAFTQRLLADGQELRGLVLPGPRPHQHGTSNTSRCGPVKASTDSRIKAKPEINRAQIGSRMNQGQRTPHSRPSSSGTLNTASDNLSGSVAGTEQV
jgi:hypothetical protein